MARDLDFRRLDVAAFARGAGRLEGETPVADLLRLADEVVASDAPLAPVRWQLRGEQRSAAGATPTPWLHLSARVTLPLVCQRCLAPVAMPLALERAFRFAPDEATAAAEDEAAEEDVLALGDGLDLLALLEDELLMALPLVPRHDSCPQPLTVAGAGLADAPPPHPFAELARLRVPKA